MRRSPSVREARKAARQSRKRADFLAAAAKAIRKHGLAAMTLADVAEAAGESATSVYYYFENREALLRSLAVENILRDARAMREAVEAAPDGPRALVAVVRATVAPYRDDFDAFLLRLWLTRRRLPKAVLDQIIPPVNEVFDLLEEKLIADQEAGKVAPEINARLRSTTVFAEAQGVLTNYALLHGVGGSAKIAMDEMLDDLCAQIVRGTELRPGNSAK